jgi:hypothetical protein
VAIVEKSTWYQQDDGIRLHKVRLARHREFAASDNRDMGNSWHHVLTYLVLGVDTGRLHHQQTGIAARHHKRRPDVPKRLPHVRANRAIVLLLQHA